MARKESFWRVSGVQLVGSGAKYKGTQEKKTPKTNKQTNKKTGWGGGGGRGEGRGRSPQSPPLFFLIFSTLRHSKLSERPEYRSEAVNVFS